MPLVALPLVVLMIAGARLPLSLAIPLHLAAFTMAALVCHGRLAADRPATVHLTEFYFWIAFGGMLGGLFNTLPRRCCSAGHRYPLVLVLALAARHGRLGEPPASWSLNDLVVPIGVGALTRRPHRVAAARPATSSQLFICASLGLPALRRVFAVPARRCDLPPAWRRCSWRARWRRTRRATGLYVSRTFFGVYRVTTTDEQARSTRCFTARRCTACRRSIRRRPGEPLTYYHREAVRSVRRSRALPSVRARGARSRRWGSASARSPAYRTPGQQWTFYEIDPEVERIARTDAYSPS